jgi:hypothetical protein
MKLWSGRVYLVSDWVYMIFYTTLCRIHGAVILDQDEIIEANISPDQGQRFPKGNHLDINVVVEDFSFRILLKRCSNNLRFGDISLEITWENIKQDIDGKQTGCVHIPIWLFFGEINQSLTLKHCIEYTKNIKSIYKSWLIEMVDNKLSVMNHEHVNGDVGLFTLVFNQQNHRVDYTQQAHSLTKKLLSELNSLVNKVCHKESICD